MSNIVLRHYQATALDLSRDFLRAGFTRLLVSGPTGMGKTELAMAMLEAAIAKSSRVSFIADRRSLVNQTSKRFTDAGIAHGVLMGNDTFGVNHATRVESAQTIQSRGLREGTDMYVLDEAHEIRPELIRLIAESGAVLIGLTATPFPAALAEPLDSHLPADERKDGTPPRYEAMVSTTTTDRLVADGHLCPFDVVAPVAVVDTEGLEIQGGEFRKAMLKDRIMRIVGDIVPTWKAQLNDRYAGEVQPTIVFGATVDDAEAIQREFRSAGYPARLVSSRENDDDNKRTIDAFRDGEYDVIVNCAMLCLDGETEILTADGWKGREEMADGDVIAAFRPDGWIEWARNEGVHRGFCSDQDMVGYGDRFRVTVGHGMLARSPGAHGWMYCEARELVGMKRQVPISGFADAIPWQPAPPQERALPQRTRIIRLASAYRKKGIADADARELAATRIRERDSSLLIKSPHELNLDECRFAGFWIGDGSRGAGGAGRTCVVAMPIEEIPRDCRVGRCADQQIGLRCQTDNQAASGEHDGRCDYMEGSSRNRLRAATKKGHRSYRAVSRQRCAVHSIPLRGAVRGVVGGAPSRGWKARQRYAPRQDNGLCESCSRRSYSGCRSVSGMARNRLAASTAKPKTFYAMVVVYAA